MLLPIQKPVPRHIGTLRAEAHGIASQCDASALKTFLETMALAAFIVFIAVIGVAI